MSFEHFSLKGGNGTPDVCAGDEEEDEDEPSQPREGEIRVVVVQPDEAAQEVMMRNELKEMQRIVGGWIEVFPIGIEGAVCVCDDEGLLKRRPWSRFVPATGAPIAGPFFIAGDGSSFRSLTPRQVEEAMSLFGTPTLGTLQLGAVDVAFSYVQAGEIVLAGSEGATRRGGFEMPGVCRVRLFSHAEMPSLSVLIATELPDNPGPSVTNAIAGIAAQACARFALDPRYVAFVEHYDDEDGERFAIVRFDLNDTPRLNRPQWSHTTRSDVEALIGQPLK